MYKRLLPVLAFALIVSGGATLVVYRLLATRINTGAAPVSTRVVVAARDLQSGGVLASADLRLADWTGPLPKGAVTNPEEVAGQGVFFAIYEGEPIVQSRLAPKGAGGGLASLIPRGMRAVAVKVNEVVGVAGFVVPGMRVDVIITGTPPDSGAARGMLARTVLQNIEVLSAGQKIDKSLEGKPETAGVVNLLVTPEQAEVLSLATNQMHVQLVLRNPLDRDQVQTNGAAFASLFVRPNSPPKKPIVRRIDPPAVKASDAQRPETVSPFVVEVFHGSTRSRKEFTSLPQETN